MRGHFPINSKVCPGRATGINFRTFANNDGPTFADLRFADSFGKARNSAGKYTFDGNYPHYRIISYVTPNALWITL